MLVGHYGVSFAAKASDNKMPLWLLFLVVQLPDIVWGIALLLGKTVVILPPIRGINPLDQYYIPPTHSILAAILTAGAFIVYMLLNGSQTLNKRTLLVGIAVLSHWVLDFLVHAPDVLYGSSFRTAFYDFGLPSFIFELFVLASGVFVYLRSTKATVPSGTQGPILFVVAMMALNTPIVFGHPPKSDEASAVIALTLYGVFAAVAFWMERKREPISVAHGV